MKLPVSRASESRWRLSCLLIGAIVLSFAGERGLAQLQEYDESIEIRNEVTRLQAGFATGTDLLREEQIDALIGILSAADKEFRRTRPRGADYNTPEQWQQLQAETLHLIRQRDQRVRDRAAAVLTPEQYASLDAWIRRVRGHEELLRIAAHIVPLGKSGVTRHAAGAPGPFLVGVNNDRLVKDGEYRSAWKQQARREIETTYVDVPQVLGLSPALTHQFFTLLAGQQLARVDNPAGPYAAWADRLRKEERELTTLLGELSTARFSEFRDAYVYRYRVKLLRVEIGAGPGALRQEQIERLIAAWRDADQQTTQDREFLHRRNARLHEAATAFLTPPQLAALDAWLERDPG